MHVTCFSRKNLYLESLIKIVSASHLIPDTYVALGAFLSRSGRLKSSKCLQADGIF